MSRAPSILITASTAKAGVEFLDVSISLSNRYLSGVFQAGGVPFTMAIIPDQKLVEEYVSRCDGVLMTGGDDINPKLYQKSLSAELKKTLELATAERDNTDLLVIKEVLRQNKPFFAICRGMQLMNIAMGGTMYVDIPLQVPAASRHSRPDLKDKIVHPMAVAKGSLLQQITGKNNFGVNSSHHQAIKDLAIGLQVTGRAPDGIIEALELSPENQSMLPWFLGVQFHPERLFQAHQTHFALFTSFIKSCTRKNKSGK